MPQYLVAVQHPEDYDPSLEREAMIRDIGALNEERDAAGARFFAGGLESASHAESLRKLPDGSVSILTAQGIRWRLLCSRARRHGRSVSLDAGSPRGLSGSCRGASVPQSQAE